MDWLDDVKALDSAVLGAVQSSGTPGVVRGRAAAATALACLIEARP